MTEVTGNKAAASVLAAGVKSGHPPARVTLRACSKAPGNKAVASNKPAGYSRRVTPLAFIHRRVRPLDGWMVVANPYHDYMNFL